MTTMLIKASEALIAWNRSGARSVKGGPVGGVAVGPLIGPDEVDWASSYDYTDSAAGGRRGAIPARELQLQVMGAWYRLVYNYGLHPYVAHRAFLLLDEYQANIKEIGAGPAPDEMGHDPDTSFGRMGYDVPAVETEWRGRSLHVWLA